MLQQRDQGTSGTKAAMARRLESGDCTRLARLSCWLSAEDNIASLLQLKNQGDRSLSRKKGRSAEPRPAPPRDPSPDAKSQCTRRKGKSSDPIEVESGSDDDGMLSAASSAELLFPNQHPQPPASPFHLQRRRSLGSQSRTHLLLLQLPLQ